MELPAIAICPKVPDGFNRTGIVGDIMGSLPNIDYDLALDVLRCQFYVSDHADNFFRYFIAGNGLENMDTISYMNRTYLSYLNNLYKNWSIGYTTEEFFNLMQVRGFQTNSVHFDGQFGFFAARCVTSQPIL